MKGKCRWKLYKIDDWYICDIKYIYETQCGNMSTILDELEAYKYCPYCGKTIEQVEEVKDEG